MPGSSDPEPNMDQSACKVNVVLLINCNCRTRPPLPVVNQCNSSLHYRTGLLIIQKLGFVQFANDSDNHSSVFAAKVDL